MHQLHVPSLTKYSHKNGGFCQTTFALITSHDCCLQPKVHFNAGEMIIWVFLKTDFRAKQSSTYKKVPGYYHNYISQED